MFEKIKLLNLILPFLKRYLFLFNPFGFASQGVVQAGAATRGEISSRFSGLALWLDAGMPGEKI